MNKNISLADKPLHFQATYDSVNETRLYVYHKADDISLISTCIVHHEIEL